MGRPAGLLGHSHLPEYLDGGRGGCEVATAGSEVATLFAL